MAQDPDRVDGAALGGKAQPARADRVVALDAPAVEEHPADIVGGVRMPGFGGGAVEGERMAVVARDAFAILVALRQGEFRRGVVGEPRRLGPGGIGAPGEHGQRHGKSSPQEGPDRRHSPCHAYGIAKTRPESAQKVISIN